MQTARGCPPRRALPPQSRRSFRRQVWRQRRTMLRRWPLRCSSTLGRPRQGVQPRGPGLRSRAPSNSLTVCTVNATAWGSAQAFLENTTHPVVALQEHHLWGDAVAEAKQWADRRGWWSHWAPGIPSQGDGVQAGVALFVKKHIGMGVAAAAGGE
eukprot:15473421-Alexandrium_andersonii.AAC.1